jgi:hypothetical protein
MVSLHGGSFVLCDVHKFMSIHSMLFTYEIQTDNVDHLHAKQTFYELSYSPKFRNIINSFPENLTG